MGRIKIFTKGAKLIKMAKVHVCNVLVLDNPAQFMSKLEFEITFECIEDLPEDLEWKIIYVGSAESEEFDQISDTVGVTVILITCAYRGQEFIRVGYYVSNEYSDPEMQETPPENPVFDKLNRNILASNPRVTKFKINWDPTNSTNQPSTSQEGEEGQLEQNTADMEDDNSKDSDSSFDENKPPKHPTGDPNALPPMKDPMLVSPMKSQPPRIPGMDNTNHSTNDGMDIE